MLEAALVYARQGTHVFPIKPGSKYPLISKEDGGRGYHDATTDEAQIRAWWTREPNANIGIAVAPSGIAVLDVDTDGKPGLESLQTLIDYVEGLPETLTVRTGGGGYHFIYKRPEGCPQGRHNDFLKRILPGAKKGSGLDIFTDGYIVAAPSLHKSGNRYEHVSGSSIIELPTSLVRVFSAPARDVVERREVNEGVEIAAGSRDTQLWKLAVSELEKGLPLELVRHTVHAANQLYCKPPMSDAEVERALSSAASQSEPSGDWFENLRFAESVLPAAVQKQQQVFTEDARMSVTPLQALTRVQASNYKIRTYPTGFDEIDKLIGGGYSSRSLSLVIAPPGDGKSAFVIGQCLNYDGPALYVSSELSSEEVMFRVAAQLMGCSWGELMRSDDHSKLREIVANANIHIIGSERLRDPSKAIDEKLRGITTEAYLLSQETGKKPLIVIDYLQNLAARDADTSVTVGKISGLLVNIALSPLDCPIVAVSSCSRQWYHTHPDIEYAVGFMSAAKESGNLDYDAALIIYLELSQEVKPNGDREARIAVAKARSGMSGFVGAVYNGGKGGQWRPDASVLDGFTKAAKAERALNEQHEEDEQKVRLRIRERGADPISVLRGNCGLTPTRAERAIRRLLERQVLEKKRITRTDQHHRTKQVEVVDFVKPPTPEPPEEPKLLPPEMPTDGANVALQWLHVANTGDASDPS